MRFDEKLISLRKQKGLSQEDLGNKIGVSRQTISKWESGQTNPEMNKLKDLSKIFEISVDELINNELETKDGKKEKQVKEIKLKIKSTNILIIISCILIVLGFASSIVFYILGKENAKVESVLYITYTTKYTDFVDMIEIYTFDEKGNCTSSNFYARCNNADDSKTLVKKILNDDDNKIVNNVSINKDEITWDEKNYENISLITLVSSKENSLKNQENLVIKVL